MDAFDLAALSRGPLAYWPLDDDGTWDDLTGNGHTLTESGAVSTAALSDGKTGAVFDGTKYLYAADDAVLRPETMTGWSVSAWLERTASPGTQMGWFGKGTNVGIPDLGVWLGCWTDYSPNHIHGSGTGSAQATANPYNRDQANSTTLPLDTVHVVWTYDYTGRLSTCWIDGVSYTVTEYGTNSDDWEWGSGSNTEPVKIGVGNASLGGFQGKIAKLGFYDYPLDAAAVSGLFTGTSSGAGEPTTVRAEIYLSGSWLDITDWTDSEFVIDRGTKSVTEEAQPGTLTMNLSCADPATGAADVRWFPDSPLSPYYGTWKEDVQLRLRVTRSGVTSTRFAGWVTSIVPEMGSTLAESVVRVTATDALGRLAQRQMRGWTYEVASLAGATGYWPMAGADVRAARIGSDASWSRSVYSSGVYPTYVTPQSDGAELSRFDAAGCAVFDPGDTSGAVSAMRARTGFASTITEWSVAAWMSTDRTGLAPLLRMVDDQLGFLAEINVRPDTIGAYAVLIGLSTTTTAGAATSQGEPVHVCLTAVKNGSGADVVLYVNGAVADSVTTGSGQWFVPDAVDFGGLQRCRIAHAVVVPSALTADEVAALGTDGTVTGFTVADVGTVFDSMVGSLCGVSADAGFGSRAGCPPRCDDVSALDVARQLAASEGAPLWDDTTGARFEARAYPTSPAWTLDVEADVDVAPVLGRSVEGRVSVATASSALGSSQATDSTLVASLGEVSADVPTVLASSVDRQARASLRISDGKNGSTRVERVAVDLVTTQTDHYATFFGLKPGEMVRVQGLPSSALGVSRVDGIVLGWTETVAAGTYRVELALAPAPVAALVGTQRVGFGDGVATLNATITDAATSIAIARTGSGDGLSLSAGDYPLDLDLNGERVTVTAAPASSTSPQTVTVTRGVAPTVARAHTAGEPVEIWDVARIAY